MKQRLLSLGVCPSSGTATFNKRTLTIFGSLSHNHVAAPGDGRTPARRNGRQKTATLVSPLAATKNQSRQQRYTYAGGRLRQMVGVNSTRANSRNINFRKRSVVG